MSCSACGNGNGRSSTASITLKIALFAPMPRARVSTAMMANPGVFANIRKANLKSPIMLLSLEDPAVAQLHDPFPVGGVFLGVRDLHDCHPFFIQVAKQLHDFLALARVQIASWLIRQQQFGRGNDGAGYSDELLLAAGKLPRIQIFFADNLKTIERVGHECGAFALTIMPIRERNIEVLVNRQIVEQMILLENESDLLISQCGALFRFKMMHRRLIEKIFAGPSVIVNAENVQEGRLVGARRSHHRNKIAGGNIEIDVAQDIKHLSASERIGAFDVMQADHVVWASASMGSARITRDVGI